MTRAGPLQLAILVAVLLGWHASAPPAALPPGASSNLFSAGRAMADVRAGFARPHPIGSAENVRVRRWLAGRMTELGLRVRVAPGIGVHATDGRIVGGEVANLVGVLPGRDPALPALLVMAHYDTAPGSPGAGDDGFGVAAALEIARALSLAPRARDVVFLVTEGEEAGLLGARAFFAGDPLAPRIGMVLNMDMRGDAGRAIMYETGPAPGPLLRLYARATPSPTTDGVAAYVRRNIRNSSDFAISAAAGLPGLNYAVLGDQFDYHAASSTPGTADPRTLQHLGDSVLAVARPLALMRMLPPAGAEPAYASLLGSATIVYPYWVGWLLLATAALAVGTAGRRRPLRAVLAGLAAALLLELGAALVFHMLRLGTGVPAGFTAVRPLLARFALFEGALLAAGIGLFLLLAARRRADLAAGLALIVLLVAALLQALAPAAAVLACWSALAAAVVLLIAPRHPIAAALLAGAGLAQVLATAHLIELAVGENLAAVGAYFLLLGAALVAPLLPHGRRLRPAGVACLVAALAATAVIRFADPGSPARPRPSQLLYVEDTDGRGWHASTLPVIDRWTEAGLLSGGARGWRRRPLPPTFVGTDYRAGAAMAPARALKLPVPQVRQEGGRLIVTAPPGTRQLDLALSLDRMGRVSVAGAAVTGRQVAVRWSAPDRPLVVRVDGAQLAGGLVSALRDGWPAGAVPLAPRSPDTMPWGNSDSSLVIRRIP